MEWPQFDLWRLLAAIGLLGVGLAFYVMPAGDRATNTVSWLCGSSFVAAAIGAPFRKGVIAGLASPLLLFLYGALVRPFFYP